MIEFYDRTSYLVFALEIPHVRGAELMSAVRYKLAGVYPGNIAERNIQIRKNGGKKWGYLVFVLDKRTGNAILPLSPLFAQHMHSPKSANVLFIEKRWLDYTRITNGVVESSTVKTRDGSRLIDDVKDLYAEETELIIYCDRADQSLLVPLHSNNNIRFLDSHAELKKTDVHKISLFSAQSPVIKLKRALAVFAVLLALVAGSLIWHRQHADENERNALLRLQQEQAQSLSHERQRETQRLAELRMQYQEIIAAKTAAPFDMAAVIAECTGLQTRIQSATFNGGFFQIEGISNNPLDLLHKFENHRLVSGARLHQVHPAGNRDTFTLSGTVHTETASVDDSALTTSEHIAALENLIAAELQYAASEAQSSPAAFGEAVQALFAKWNCTVSSYQFLNEPHKTELEYSLRGAGTGFFNALYEINSNHRPWEVRLVQIRNLYPRDMLDIVIRIRTEYHPADTGGAGAAPAEAASPYPVTSISRNYFPPAPSPRHSAQPSIASEPPPMPPPARTERVSWLEYVGSVHDNSDNRYVYVKDTRTGNIFKLGPFVEGNMRYAASPSGGIIAFIDGHIYEINRR
jgi:competence protein ComGC